MAEWQDKMPGGLADDKSPADFDPEAVLKGMQVELEHTDDKRTASPLTRLRKQTAIGGLQSLPTFRENKTAAVHSWFTYVEGFSAALVRGALESLPYAPTAVLDPFSGSGTTGVEAMRSGAQFQGYDINPVMKLLADAKTISSVRLARDLQAGTLTEIDLQAAVEMVCCRIPDACIDLSLFSDKAYFPPHNLQALRRMRSNIDAINNKHLRQVFLACLLSILVEVSFLKRSPDLKYRAEIDRKRPNAYKMFRTMIGRIATDLRGAGDLCHVGKARNHWASAKNLSFTRTESVDVVITSPPYLNGTNYIRNTKLELWIGGFATTPADLKKLRSMMVSCSINSAQNTDLVRTRWPQINRTIESVRKAAYDPRIAPMVAHYFRDMEAVLAEMQRVLRRRRRAYIVIGDSAFAGVHVPTHDHLSRIASDLGFNVRDRLSLRARRSRSGKPLTEEIIELVRQ